ncbi:MAG: type II toxin-antitoxin system Phd/YefM family antitoxin [Betaproteobacteria bacterium]|nr:type II toxin-antitoxin system Phd/YefM family antitoxin [Betaproteobacteria bacterium]
MISINIHEAKTQLSKYLAKLRPGESLLICKRNVPVAELRALPRQASKPRPIGLAKAEFSVPESFFEPLPEDMLKTFEAGPV